MIDKHFPKNSKFNKYFNRNSIKVSYCTMPNMAKIISGHNKKVMKPPTLTDKTCNCRKRDECPLDGNCLVTDMVYKCEVKTANTNQEYIGLTSNTFKQRFTTHKGTFKHQHQAHSTTLSSHIWDLKSKQIPHTTNWSVLGLAPSYSRKVRMCHLCLLEKTFIATADSRKALNKRNEIISKCRHRDKTLLKNW